jgi:DNA mismatch repair protein MutS2
MKLAKIYPSDGLDKLEFNKIFSLTKSHCLSDLGVKQLDKVKVSADKNFIIMALKQVFEMKNILQLEGGFPNSYYFDLSEALTYIELENSVLPLEQWIDVMFYLLTMEEIFVFFQTRKELYPTLFEFLKGQSFEGNLLKTIKRVITDDGQIRLGVSPALDRVKKEIKSKERDIDNVFSKIKRRASESKWLESGEESIIDGRRVLMLLSEHKRKIKGIIRDESATGKTAYLEPEETLELYNDLFELQQEERREIYKILKELTEQVRPFCPIMRHYQTLTGVIDFIRAKALTSIDLNGQMPVISDEVELHLIAAKNPILTLLAQKSNKKVIPFGFNLNNEERILLVSGPNAGGKSVLLKSVGLLQVMLQSGFLITTSPDSTFGIFDQIFIELGDEQSIENELSTFSSRLTHAKYFIEKSNPKTLFFIDEFGTGTDPKFGGALAEAILEELNLKKAFGVVNTHYGNLKLFASKTDGIINAAMQFDKDNLQPLYQLSLGNPGSSYAFEIAQKIGLSPKTIIRAGGKMEKDFQDYDKLLSNLESEKLLLQARKKALDENESHFNQLLDTYRQLKEELERNKKKFEIDAKNKAMDSVIKTRIQMEELLKQYKKDLKDEQKRLDLSKVIQVEEEKIVEQVQVLKQEKKKFIHQEVITEGSNVKLIDGNMVGQVEFIKNDRAYILFGNVRTQIKLSDLEPVSKTKAKELEKKTVVDFASISNELKPEIDVRGYRGNEALYEVEVQLDKALILGLSQLRILHGTGDGILKRLIRDNLRKYSFVNRFYSEKPEFGGEGITIVELN